MRYRLTLLDAPPDSPIGGCEEFETWEDAEKQTLFVVTRAKFAWTAIAIEVWQPDGGKWVLDGYASEAAIKEMNSKAAASDDSREQYRKQLLRVLRRGSGKVRKDWQRKAMTRIGESLAPYLARAAATGSGVRLTAQEVLRLQLSTEVIGPTVHLIKPNEERCCLCGLDYGECHEDGSVIPFQALCEYCAGEVKVKKREGQRQAVRTARTAARKDAE